MAILKRIVKRANEWKKHKLVLKEVPYETTKTLIGHSSIKTTIDVYTRIKKEHMKKVRTDIEAIIKIF